MYHCLGTILALALLALYTLAIFINGYGVAEADIKRNICNITAWSKEEFESCSNKDLDALIFELKERKN